ncbi:TonB-dependent receptor domain-containing protein [Tellurirhabdus rosea]|uniref:TonB-dependent receptor domain-containing protein n=1 Tax=Tellurirhabdus rosea TaxID=2674997 RepID=UPI0022575C40|nr:TonB-dependent receptor [Tellurirhabdus rosea]
MVRLTTFLILFLSALTATFANDTEAGGTLRGQVTDPSGAPVSGATIRIKGTIRGTVTDEKGHFTLTNLPKGGYTVQLSGVALTPVERTVEIKANETLALDIAVRETVQQLAEVKIVAARGLRELERLPEVDGTALFAGKKTEVINLSQLDANLVTNNTRQIFSKTPGVMVWENDGSGMQVGVAVRGLSPNRSWEFNVRQNGYDVSPDPFGYPEAYYNPPMEAVEQIQLVRGAASLQYGPQFGGLLNYVLKKPDATRKFGFETQQSAGSFGLFSTYNAISGTVGKLSYTAYAHYRRADGWRENSRYGIFNGYASVQYAVSNKLKLGFELSRLYNESQQPGGLTDVQFAQNARQSVRGRNWFSTPWTVPVLSAEYAFSDKTRLTWKVHGLVGERNSIGFVRPINTLDVPTNGVLAARQIDRDHYRNWGSELRLLTTYSLLGRDHTLATGVKYFNGYTRRRQLGRGDTGSDFNLNLAEAAFPRDLDLRVQNVAYFAENVFRLTPRWTVTPGFRLEHLANDISGRFSLNANGTENRVSQNSVRNFLLLGIGTEYKLLPTTTLYANLSQAYRPLLFSDLTPGAVTDFVIDPNLQDSRGGNLDLGLRGNLRNFLNFDVSYFRMQYNNRVGTLTLLNEASRPYQFRTNVGNSLSQGVEAYVEFDPIVAFVGRSKAGYLSLFTSASYTDARYTTLRTVGVSNGQQTETSLRDRRVENAPEFIGRFGANYSLKGFTLTALLNRVGKAYSDANNTETPAANGQTGVIPAYQVLDVSATYRFARRYNVRAGVNNLTDERYFTRRAGGYPGPGLLPGDGRNWFVSVGYKL